MIDAVLFRVDAARRPGLSFGHLFRCLALAEELRDRAGIQCRFLMKADRDALATVQGRGFPTDILPENLDPESEAEYLAATPERFVVIDLPPFLWPAFPLPSRSGRVVTVVDDLGDTCIAADQIVNGTIVAERHRYAGSGAADRSAAPRLFLGPRYAVLGPAFDAAPTERPTRDGRLLVTFGGSDPAGLTERAAALLKRRPPSIGVDVVVGPGYAGGAPLLQADATLIRNPAELAPLMRRSVAAVAAGGRTAYELARLGVPAVLIASIDHEAATVRAFAAAGCALAIERWDEDRVATALERLLSDAAFRESLAEAGPRLIDGQGRKRVAALVLGSGA